MKQTALFIAALLTASLLACGEKREANRKPETGPQARVLATVNGVPITEHDLKQVLRRGGGGHGGESPKSPEASPNVLQNLVRDELIYQRSVELGLDKDEEYRRKRDEAEAQLRASLRQEMSTLFRRHVGKNFEVTDGEVKAYFDKNRKTLQTTFHVWQLFYRGGDPRMARDLQDLKSGVPFEKVAARPFPDLPKGMPPPWDLGDLHWNQIPEPWQSVLDRLAPGQVSELIQGPRDRSWVIKLVKKTVDPRITLATEKEKIAEIVKKQKADTLYDRMLAEMKDKAKIVYPK